MSGSILFCYVVFYSIVSYCFWLRSYLARLSYIVYVLNCNYFIISYLYRPSHISYLSYLSYPSSLSYLSHRSNYPAYHMYMYIILYIYLSHQSFLYSTIYLFVYCIYLIYLRYFIYVLFKLVLSYLMSPYPIPFYPITQHIYTIFYNMHSTHMHIIYIYIYVYIYTHTISISMSISISISLYLHIYIYISLYWSIYIYIYIYIYTSYLSTYAKDALHIFAPQIQIWGRRGPGRWTGRHRRRGFAAWPGTVVSLGMLP